jgi:type IV pilus assembly protein PilY1
MGYITGTPAIVKINFNKSSSHNEGYFVVVTSGYNSSNANGDVFLYLLSLDKDSTSPWILNSNYYKIKTSNSNPSLANALTSPALVLTAQGTLRYAYSGDLQGNIWRFNFTEGIAKSGAPTMIFSSKDSNGNHQKITAPPVTTIAPEGGYLVLFGTGKYVEESDKNRSQFKTQSFYAIRDSTKDKEKIAGRNDLAPRQLSSITTQGKTAFTISGQEFNYGSGTNIKHGWYMDFVNSSKTGERSISSAVIAQGQLFFNTHIPTDLAHQASSNSYALNALSGLSTNTENTTGYNTQHAISGHPLLILESTIQNQTPTKKLIVNTTFSVLTISSNGTHNALNIVESGTFKTDHAGRLSWREIQNWRELNAPKNPK